MSEKQTEKHISQAKKKLERLKDLIKAIENSFDDEYLRKNNRIVNISIFILESLSSATDKAMSDINKFNFK